MRALATVAFTMALALALVRCGHTCSGDYPCAFPTDVPVPPPSPLVDASCEAGTCTCTTGDVVVVGTVFCGPTVAVCDCNVPPDAAVHMD